MRELDLHHTRHHLVRNKLIRFVEDNWDTGVEVKIITGNSHSMKDIVKKVLDEYKVEYREGDYSGVNMGFIKVEL